MHLTFLVPAAPGHVNPTLPLVSELVRRGHVVSFAATPEIAPEVEAAGARVIPLPVRVPTRTLSTMNFTAEELAAFLEEIHETTEASYPTLAAELKQAQPDVLCFDTIDSTGRILAAELNIPAVGLVTSLASNDATPMTSTFMPEDLDFGHPRLHAIWGRMADFAREHGAGDGHGEVAAPLNLVFVPRSFQPNAETFDERFRFIGPAPQARNTRNGPWRPARSDRPLVFISLGTVVNRRPEFFRACLDAFADDAWEVAMAVGNNVDIAELGPLPGNCEVQPSLPQLDVLEHASVFVTHAGMGSTMESLALGVPLVCVPQVPEQRTNARRVEELGLGQVLDAPRPTAIRGAVDAVSVDADLRARVEDMARTISACGGPTEGAAALEEYARR